MYPEIGFDLPKTLALVCQELDAMGIPYTDKWGKSSVVATLNEEKSHFTIGLRADMDALPIQEVKDLPYKSKNEGVMHACGHDSHIAMLLSAAKVLSEHRDELNCTVKFIFQPAEEAMNGALSILDSGLVDDLDTVAGGQRVSCTCVLGGGGKGDSNDKTCACVAAGMGYTKRGQDRCFCAIGGAGYDY